jgi:hypothetical protein
MKVSHLIRCCALTLVLIGAPKSMGAEIKGFKSALFGATEGAVLRAIKTDLGAPASAVKSRVDTSSGMRILEVNLPDFEPLGVPATVNYYLGFKCRCLTQVSINWQLSDQLNKRKKEWAMMAIGALRAHFAKMDWPKDQAIFDRAIGDVKVGSTVPYVFFRGLTERNTLVVLAGEPVLISAGKNKSEKLAASFEPMRTVQLFYQLDSQHPDVRKINIQGF